MTLFNRAKTLEEAVIMLFRDGYTGTEIVRNKDLLNGLNNPHLDWSSIKQSSLNRWINSAKKEDADLEIWHLLNRRRRRPGMYTNWQPSGVVILGPHHEPLNVKPDSNARIQTVNRVPSKFVSIGPTRRTRARKTRYSINDADAVGLYVVELKNLGYSLRDIVDLWNGGKTRHPDRDKVPRVLWLVNQMRAVRPQAMSYTTIRRILQTYSIGPV